MAKAKGVNAADDGDDIEKVDDGDEHPAKPAHAHPPTHSHRPPPVPPVLSDAARMDELHQRAVRAEADAHAARAELAALRPTDTPSTFTGPNLRFLVRVKDAPTWCVECRHHVLAFDAYKEATGVISTPHAPVVTRAADDHPLGRVIE